MYNPYIISLWNNNKPVVNNVEQWEEVDELFAASRGSPPTITNGVLTNIPIGVYNFNITGSVWNSTLVVAQLQYKPTGGNFITVATQGVIDSFAPISINATIKISSTTDSIQLYYNYYNNYNDINIEVQDDPSHNSLFRYMTITFVSL